MPRQQGWLPFEVTDGRDAVSTWRVNSAWPCSLSATSSMCACTSWLRLAFWAPMGTGPPRVRLSLNPAHACQDHSSAHACRSHPSATCRPCDVCAVLGLALHMEPLRPQLGADNGRWASVAGVIGGTPWPKVPQVSKRPSRHLSRSATPSQHWHWSSAFVCNSAHDVPGVCNESGWSGAHSTLVRKLTRSWSV